MASSGERRMLFDTSGRRRRVIQVVYAILALLMGASLFLVIGPVNVGELIGNSAGGGGSASQVFDEQAERIEARLVKNPRDEQQMLALTRARINAGNAEVEAVEGQLPRIGPEAREDFEAAGSAWNRYLKLAGDEPSAAGAQLVAAAFFQLAEGSANNLREIKRNIARATAAQRIAAEQQPNTGSLSNLAIYQYFNGDYAAGDRTTKRVVAEANSKNEAKAFEEQLDEFRKRAKQFEKNAKRSARQERKLQREALRNPFTGPGTAPGGGAAAGGN
jgi:hypothetical protein